MSAVAERIAEVRVGEAQRHLNLILFPLLAEDPGQPGYLLLDEALALGLARVTEVSAAGHVPELKFVNEADRPVLLLDGEELVGAKQNRILNLTVLAPAHTSIVIPVSCVEAGRWHSRSHEFASAGRAHFAEGRARKAARVSESLHASGSRRSDQGEVWHDIAAKSARMDAASDTAAAAALYERHRTSLDGYLTAFRPVAQQAGALFAINGQIVGLDLFDSPATLHGLLGKLVESYALDAVDQAGSAATADLERPEDLLAQAARARYQRFAALGEGEDWRLYDSLLSGGALVKDAKVVHLCVFRMGVGDGALRSRGSHIARASARARNR